MPDDREAQPVASAAKGKLAKAKEWLRQHWKPVLAVLAGVVLAWYIFLRKSGSASVLTPTATPTGNGGGGTGGGGAGIADPGTTAVSPTVPTNNVGPDPTLLDTTQFALPLSALAVQQDLVWVKQVGGASVQVPKAVVDNSSRSLAELKSAGVTSVGGAPVNTAQPYVAGKAPASASSPAGGGTYAGLTDSQTASLFQNTYGSGWQSVWSSQHAAEVAANGA